MFRVSAVDDKGNDHDKLITMMLQRLVDYSLY